MTAKTSVSRGLSFPLAALMIAIASVLDPLSRNLHQASFPDAVPALLATAAFVLLVWLVAAAVRRRADAGAALIAWVWALGRSLLPPSWSATSTRPSAATTRRCARCPSRSPSCWR